MSLSERLVWSSIRLGARVFYGDTTQADWIYEKVRRPRTLWLVARNMLNYRLGRPRVAALVTLPTALRRRVLRRMALAAGCPAGSLHRSHVEALDALVVRWRGQGPVALPGGRQGSRACGRLALVVPAQAR